MYEYWSYCPRWEKRTLMQNFLHRVSRDFEQAQSVCNRNNRKVDRRSNQLSIHKYLAGHLGGEQQMSAQIAQNDIDALIFLRDPMAKPHEPEVNGVIKLCDMHNIPMATNLATAELIILSIDRGDLDWREIYR